MFRAAASRKEFGEQKIELRGPLFTLEWPRKESRGGGSSLYNSRVALPFWLDEPYTARTPLEGDVTAEVAVLGGGLTGVAAAHFLADRGCRVVLVERDVLASGASGRNAGFLLCGVAN